VNARPSDRTIFRWTVNLFIFIINDIWGLIFIIVALFIDRSYFQGVTGDDFEISPTFIAGDDLTFFDVVDIDVQGIVTLWADD